MSPLTALFLSLVPGLGHLAAGKVGMGVGWFLAVAVAYSVHPMLGFLVHLVTAGHAFFAAQQLQTQQIAAQGAQGAYVPPDEAAPALDAAPAPFAVDGVHAYDPAPAFVAAPPAYPAVSAPHLDLLRQSASRGDAERLLVAAPRDLSAEMPPGRVPLPDPAPVQDAPLLAAEAFTADTLAEAILAAPPSEHPAWAVRAAAARLAPAEAARLLGRIDAHARAGGMARPDALRFHAALS